MEQVTLQVKGMSCGHCVKTIEGNVGKLDGVNSVKVDLTKAEVYVEFNPNQINVIQIKETIEDQGYEVE
ncbi:copper chaperone CopZ [Peribacillus alkalitolerans]|uniref:copper chaperone CopZ n=1 Tax=Peribacillus alkalitolerans TaxID=1550385 RepID=UPI0013D671AA|nr:copper chaperone CopZ [Peribacillus alkalitolerans]